MIDHMPNQMVTTPEAQAGALALEKLILGGDLSLLQPLEKVEFYKNACATQGLNPLTRPFIFMKAKDGKEFLYCGKDGSEQLRELHKISLKVVNREIQGDLFIVTVQATNKHGRVDESIGVKSIKGLAGENHANAIMVAETKAKRRVTLSICGLGFLDMTPDDMDSGMGKPIHFDFDTGEIIEPAKPQAIKNDPLTELQQRNAQDDAIKEIVNPIINMKTIDDKLTALYFWTELSKEVKTAVWEKLDETHKEWIKMLVNNKPKDKPSDADYIST